MKVQPEEVVDSEPPESGQASVQKPISTLSHRVGRVAQTIAHLALALLLIGAGAFVLHSRVAADASSDPVDTLFVSTQTADMQNGYSLRRRFAGRIEAARQVPLASELGGTVVSIAVREGQQVAQGDVIAKLDLRSIKAARSQQRARRRALEKDRELALLEANRQLQLKEKGYTSGQAWDAARLRVESLDSSIAQIDGALRAIRVNITKSAVVAPFDGIVGARLVDEGSTLASGAPLVTLFEMRARQARIGLPPVVANELVESRQYELEVNGQRVLATLEQLRPDLNNATQTVTAVFKLQSDSVPRFGEVVQLILAQNQPVKGFWLPLTALKEGERGLWDVLIAKPADDAGHFVVHETVEVLHSDGDRAYVRGALPVGAHIIANGTHRVTVGQAVRITRDQ